MIVLKIIDVFFAKSIFEGTVPIVGMPIEIRDDQYIWSSSRIHQVHKGETLYCTIRYDGWGAKWDEPVRWENNPRLAKIGTFTKRALCYVNLSSDANMKRLWPSVVNIRMPDPRSNKDVYEEAANELSIEKKVFIQPYCEDLLPKYVSSKIMNGGMWIKRRYVKEWRDRKEIPSKDTLSTHFKKAYDLALADKDVTNTLPKSVFEGVGTLVKQAYRVVAEGQRNYQNMTSQKLHVKKSRAFSRMKVKRQCSYFREGDVTASSKSNRKVTPRLKRAKKARVSKCQRVDFREGGVVASSLQFPDLNKGGEKIGEFTVTKIRVSSRGTQANTFLSHLLGRRIKIIDVPLSKDEQSSYEIKFEQHGNVYELISVKQQSDIEVNTFGSPKCARLMYAQISGNGLEAVDIKDWLCRLADFQASLLGNLSPVWSFFRALAINSHLVIMRVFGLTWPYLRS